MKKALTLVLAALMIAAFAGSALAWEFSMTGEYENRLTYIGRLGDTDLFGYAPTQDRTDIAGDNPAEIAANQGWVGFAGPNIYNRGADPAAATDWAGGLDPDNKNVIITRGGYSRWGSDALYNDSALTLNPVIRVNKAIRVHGVYHVGGYRNRYNQTAAGAGLVPFEDYYSSQSSLNAYDGTLGTWRQFRSTVQVPWGVFSFGLKDFPLGTGATLGYNTRAESFLTVVPYGPFRFLYAVWLARSRNLSDGAVAPHGWNNVPDGAHKNDVFQGLIFTYDNGPLNIGGGTIYRNYHLTAGEVHDVLGAGGAGATTSDGPIDTSSWINLAYFKYNNGRFFANAEFATINIDVYRSNLAVAGALVGQSYHTGYHGFAELGTVLGPTKLSLMFAQASGPYNDANRTKEAIPWPINYQAMEPYEMLLFNTYGGGDQTFDGLFVSDGHGMLGNGYALAARLDYAVASNLNVWGSYLWAHRLEQTSTPVGKWGVDGRSTYPGLGTGGAPHAGAALTGWLGGLNAANAVVAAGRTNPFVDDGFLGYEVGAGVSWKLLEGMTFNARYAYWQPGEWFDLAYQAVAPTAAGGSDVTLIEGRSAINAFQGSMLIEF